jgi:hypothetical protein
MGSLEFVPQFLKDVGEFLALTDNHPYRAFRYHKSASEVKNPPKLVELPWQKMLLRV